MSERVKRDAVESVYPLRNGYHAVATEEVLHAVRNVLPNWCGRDWQAVRQTLASVWPGNQYDDYTMDDVQMRFAIGQNIIKLKIMRTAVIIGQNYPDAELVEIVGMHDRTIVFEPLPEAAEACRKAFANDPRLIVFQAACGESFTISKLNIYNHHGLSSSLGELTAEAREIYTTQDLSHKGSISVQVVNAAYILQMIGVQFIDFLLIDAQGMDFAILQTLQSYLEATAIGFIQIEADGAGFVHYTDTPDNSEESILAYMQRFPAYIASRQPGRMAEQPDLLFAICGK